MFAFFFLLHRECGLCPTHYPSWLSLKFSGMLRLPSSESSCQRRLRLTNPENGGINLHRNVRNCLLVNAL